MRYYKCTNCGTYKDLKVDLRSEVVKCSTCGYDEPMAMTKEEWQESGKVRPWILEGKTYEEWEENN